MGDIKRYCVRLLPEKLYAATLPSCESVEIMPDMLIERSGVYKRMQRGNLTWYFSTEF